MFQRHDVVRIVGLQRRFATAIEPPSRRAPRIGDEAWVVEVYETPTPGYELECTGGSGGTQWLVSIPAHAVDLELVARGATADD